MKQRKQKFLFIIAASFCALGLFLYGYVNNSNREQEKKSVVTELTKSNNENSSVSVNEQQAKKVKIESATLHQFVSHRDAVGYVDFNQDTTVQVFPTVTGKIKQVFVVAGDDVKKGQALYSIDSPDLAQALSMLVSTAGVFDSSKRTLARAKQMVTIQAASQKDLDQAAADQQTAEVNYQAARDAVRIFGKSEQEIDKTISTRKINSELIVSSPIAGRVVSRNAAPGLFVQPTGGISAPIAVADVSSMWLIANVAEADIPKLKLNQKIAVSITALPDQVLEGRITNIGASIDPSTRRLAVRTEIQDTKQLLKQQMLATYVIETSEPVHLVAVPANGIVREGDGTMTVFVTSDSRTFTRRAVRVGPEQQGWVPILEGLKDGENVATDGAIFLNNALQLQAR